MGWGLAFDDFVRVVRRPLDFAVGGGLATVPAATYSLTMFVTALIYVAVLRRTQGTEAKFTA